MLDDSFSDYGCDLCGSPDAAEIESVKRYTDGVPLHVCKNCGFVYVKRRRSAERIAEVWSDEIYGDDYQYGGTYTARMPAMKARQTYVADYVDVALGLKGKRLLDIGGGEGQFLDMVRHEPYGSDVFAVEPSMQNCKTMREMGISSFCGTAEDYAASDIAMSLRFDITTVMWTMVNCVSPKALIDAAYDALDEGGSLVLAEGSRLLVPFRKPMQYYLAPGPQDTHAFHYSANALAGFLATGGFEVTHINRYIDTDYLVVIGKKTDRSREIAWEKDDWRQVIDFFDRWDKETQDHYKEA